MKPTSIENMVRLDLAVPYMEKRLALRKNQLSEVIKTGKATDQQIYEAENLVIETTWLLEYFKSFNALAALAVVELLL